MVMVWVVEKEMLRWYTELVLLHLQPFFSEEYFVIYPLGPDAVTLYFPGVNVEQKSGLIAHAENTAFE